MEVYAENKPSMGEAKILIENFDPSEGLFSSKNIVRLNKSAYCKVKQAAKELGWEPETTQQITD